MLRGKPSRQSGQDLRDVPTYTIPEAAQALGMPSRTLRSWYRDYNLLKASGQVGSVTLLSFHDVSEAYVLEVIRKLCRFDIGTLREIVSNARRETPYSRPLLEADLKIVLNNVVFDSPEQGTSPRTSVDLAHHRNLVIVGLVDTIGMRVLKDRQQIPCRIYPWRHLGSNGENVPVTPVTIDPTIMSGRPVVTGTRIPVTLLAGLRRSGRSVEDIASMYDLPADLLRKALRHVDRSVSQVA